MKLDGGTGEVLWSLHYASPGAENESTYALALDAAGNAFITGRAWIDGREDEFATFRIDGVTGEIDWDEVEGGEDHLDDRGLDIAVGPDGNPVSVGLLQNADGSADFMVVKYDAASGGTVWADHAFPLVNDATGDGWVAVDAAGDVLACCKTWGGATSYDLTLLKYAGDDGELLWSRIWSNGTAADDPADMMLDAAGDPVVVGVTAGDYLVARFDGIDGDLVWFSTYAGPQGWYDVATCVAEGDGGEILVSGFSDGSGTSWDVATLGLEPDAGELNWSVRYDGADSLTDEARDIHLTAQGDLLVSGYCYGTATSMDLLLVSYAHRTDVDAPPIQARGLVLRAAPNPFNPATILNFDLPAASYVDLAVYDPAGRRVATLLSGPVPAGMRRVRWDGRGDDGTPAASGVYFARLQAGGIRSAIKVLLAK